MPNASTLQPFLSLPPSSASDHPLAALSVFGLLALLTVQVATALFANVDIAFVGPLFDRVGKALSNRLTGLHHLLSNLLIALAVLHVAAIAYYGHFKKQKLVKPMVTGWKEGEGESTRGGGLIALIVALVLAAAALYGANGAWLPAPPPPPPAAETPDW